MKSDQEIIKELRSAIHGLANAFARLNGAVELARDRPEVFSIKLEAERAAACAKFQATMDALKY